ncbi:reverse transcriptase domain-containing protein [Tanacetum coccineum]|uniref:Reverse transcriptase domain-containing protein n=1 Tax=Tanacetum coccineum TaxID=301880 RepID=A0ABQ4XJ82_9ASTR
MVLATTSLTGFSGETIWPLGQLRLLVTIGDVDHSTKAWMNFMIVRSLSPYNGIIGRPGIREIQAVPSTAYGMLKFPANRGIVTICSTILIPAECTTVITSSKEVPTKAEVRLKIFKIALHPNFLDQEVAIGGTLFTEGRTKLCSLLKKNLDIFVWQPSDMTGVPRSAQKRSKAIQAEVQKLVEAGIMREVYYHDWLSNPVMVKKHDGSWRMYVDFTDLNKACPQDCYPLPEIDWKVESLCGYPFKYFLNAYKGYHQIQMAESDEEKTAFYTSQGVYCYTKMPFGLKNADATYQRLEEMIRDINETFPTLQRINMKLNPKKCTFGAREGMFLGYMISPEGIKPCPDKTEAVLQLPSPRTIKEKCIKKSDFHWTPEAKQAFTQLKQHLSELPLLVAPKPKEELIVYLAASYGAISAVLMTERDTVQTPVYFVSRALQGPELNYSPMEKLVLSLVFTAIRLRRKVTEIECNARRTQYHLPTKDACERTDPSRFPRRKTGRELARDTSDKYSFTYALRFQFTASNNEAEYEALIAGLRIASKMGVRNVRVSVDSKLVANQVLGAYVAKEQNMIKYLEKVKSLVIGFASFSISQVPRSKNKKADALSKIASTSFAHLSKQVLVEILKEKSIHEEEVATVVEEEGTTWMTPIIDYLKDRNLPGDRNEARKLRIKARQYELLEGILYKQSFLKPWLRCVRQLQADYVIQEIHEGSCSMHAGPRSVVAKAMRLGYYWPTMHQDAREKIRTCNDCQIHPPVPRNPQHPLTPITAPWPFYKWVIDIDGPFLEGSGKVKFLIVAMDYFTKWIEAKGVATITGNQVKKFVWDNIVCRFGLPREIISDNDKQFSDNPFKNWCDKLNITQRFASVKHPQSNGLSSHGDTPFSLTYGTEAVIPAEIRMPTYRTATVDNVHNDEELWLNLDLLEEKRERASICEAKAKMKMINNDASHAAAGEKLGPKWEGPYEVTKALGDGAYKLRTMGGADLPRTWNIANVKKCYL